MVPIEERVIRFEDSDLVWPFEGSEGPHFLTRPVRAYGRSIAVDPFPAYAHSAERVVATATAIEACFPVPHPPQYYLLPFESTHRTNGWANEYEIYESDRDPRLPREFETSVVLSGKRIPIHPAMTRYLVAHEYGHIVDWTIARRLNLPDGKFRADYLQRLRPDAGNEYGGRHWHANIGELIANDFRICVTGVELEFWPHPGFKYPLDDPAIIAFWAQVQAEACE